MDQIVNHDKVKFSKLKANRRCACKYIKIPKYAIKMSDFIKELKTRPQFLKASVIKSSSKYTRFLLRLIFWIQKPVANVYILSKNDDKIVNNLADLLLTGTHMNVNNEYTTVVYA